MDKSLIDLFEEQVLKTPGNVAVVFEKQQLSYQELNARANQLAHYLRSKGVNDETLIPLYIERGINMLAALLGIMKAGCAYVPIDTDFPADRVLYMLQDTGASFLVSSIESSSKLPAGAAIDIIKMEDIVGQPVENLSAKVKPQQLAYVIYTSGSTGMPKGVMVEHRNLVDYTTGLIEKTGMVECRSFALVSTIATDLGNTVIYGSLATGGALHVFSKEAVSNIELLHQYFSVHNIDCLKIVPSHWKVLNLDGRLLLPGKLLIFGGEALQSKLLEEIRNTKTECRIVNHYGPTETTIGKLLHIVEPDAKYEYTVPIGKPFSDTKILVLTKNLKLCPIGIPGQLYIAGEGVARGYLNNETLTKEKFIPNPFSKGAYPVMYSTGDLVKYLPDGNISFIGRADNQVKIRGYRIELGEIETMLHQSNLVSQAVVLAKEDKNDDKRLVGYIVPEGFFDREGILTFLKEKLPEYMVPSVLMELESFPLTANGKIDRNALPDPDAAGLLTDQYVAPRNDVEAKLAALWQDILDVDQLGVNDDFFELGGHSLLAVRLVSAIRKAFVVEMPISDIFDFPTVALLAAQLS
ncbi:MAG: amino acid adenylation domain-containing protein, partial [Ferruginibacter sp.]